MKYIHFLIILFFITSNSSAQDNKNVFSIGNPDQIKGLHEVIFFGYDMANLRCTVKERDMSDFALCTKIPGEIINWMQAQYGTKKIRKGLNVEKLPFDNSTVQLRVKDVKQDCLTTEIYTISESQVRDIVESYNIPNKYTGKTGFVGIVENLNRIRGGKGYATIYFVFFDCSTKKVLYACHSYGNDAGGNTMRSFWGEAIMKAYKKFFKTI